MVASSAGVKSVEGSADEGKSVAASALVDGESIESLSSVITCDFSGPPFPWILRLSEKTLIAHPPVACVTTLYQ